MLSLSHATLLCRGGELIAYPTETFFGIGTSPLSESGGIPKLLELKNRELKAGIPLIIDSAKRVSEWVVRESDSLKSKREELQSKFWPGPLTIVFTVDEIFRKNFDAGVFGSDFSLAVRVSSAELATALASQLGGAVTSTSANLHGKSPARTPEEVLSYFPEMPILNFQEQPLENTAELPSTIVDVRKMPFRILREGAVSKESLSGFVGI